MQGVLVKQSGEQGPRHALSRLAILTALCAVYYLAGKLGLQLAFVNPSATPIWPPTGIALAAFLILGDSAGPAILLGAFLVNVTTSGSVPTSIAIAIGNTLEGLIGAYLINRFAHGLKVFNRAQDVFKFAILAGLFSTAVSATVGATSLYWSGLLSLSEYPAVWLTWWLGDAGGSLIVAPALILWATQPQIRADSTRALEASMLLAVLFLLALGVFGARSPLAARHYPLEFVFMPVIIWAAYRFRQRAAATVTLILSTVAILGTLHGLGPFVRELPNESLLLVQGFMGIVSITGLGLAALVSERIELDAGRAQVYRRLKENMGDLEDQSRKFMYLNEMSDMLQSCHTFEEAYSVIGQLGQQLFPEEAGALYMINQSQTQLEVGVSWGMPTSRPNSFSMDSCWALRRGRTHTYVANGAGLELLCPHLKDSPPAFAQCILMGAQGETMGLLHIQHNLPADDERAIRSRTRLQIAAPMADSMALALANLKLRLYLHDQSIRDPLTGLYNRRFLEETLDREFSRARREERPVGLLMLDLDNFKLFNDRYGHEAGDTLLRRLGGFLKENIRAGDIACRYGGEEFALVLPEMALEHVRERAEQLREGIKQIIVQYQGQPLSALTLSLGVAMFPLHGATGHEVLSAADAALYMAKGMGRDRVVVAPVTTEGSSVA